MINSQRKLSKNEAKADGSTRNGENWISEDWSTSLGSPAPRDSYTWNQLALGCLVTWNNRFLFFFWLKSLYWGSLSQALKQKTPYLLHYGRMGCELGTSPFYEIKSPEPVPGYLLVWEYLSLFQIPCFHVCSFFLLKYVCGDTWPTLRDLSSLRRGLSPVTATQEGFTQDNWPASEAERDLLTLGHPYLALELILLFPFCVSEALSLPAPGWVLLFWWFLYQDAVDRVFGLLFLVIHNRCHLLVTLWNTFLPWNWKWKGSWLSLFPNFVRIS